MLYKAPLPIVSVSERDSAVADVSSVIIHTTTSSSSVVPAGRTGRLPGDLLVLVRKTRAAKKAQIILYPDDFALANILANRLKRELKEYSEQV